jgi:hypothetical protein
MRSELMECAAPRNLALRMARAPGGLLVHANSGVAKIYEELLADQCVEKLDCEIPLLLRYRTTAQGFAAMRAPLPRYSSRHAAVASR